MEQPGPAYNGSEPYVFVSYSHEDEAIVYREVRWLQDQGVNVWYDAKIQAGSEWSDALANAINGCSRFLYFITPNSVASENCRRELNHALEETRSILAVHLQDTEVPGGIRLNLNNRQAILKHRLSPADYRTALLDALTNDRAPPLESGKAKSTPPKKGLQLATGTALLALFAIAAVWVWQRSPLESAPTEVASSVEKPLTSIAVLPFDDLSPDGDHDWLVNGMAEDLIEALGRIEDLHVPARRSTAIVKDSGADLATVGERLKVGSVVEGSVRRIGDKLSVLARWVSVRDGARLWSARFDRQFDDVFAIQKEISVGIAEAIRTELGIQDAPASMLSERYETSDLRAWELLKKAAPLAETREPAKVAEAKQMLLLAAKYDPDFMAVQEQLAWIEYREDVGKGIERAKDILQSDPSYRAVLALFAWDSAARYWDYETAEQLLQHIPVNEQTPRILETEWTMFVNTGRLERAMSAAQLAVRLDPMWARAHCNLGFLHDWSGDSGSALASYEKALAVQQETGQAGAWCGWMLAGIYERLGRESESASIHLQVTATRSQLHDAIRRGWESDGANGISLALAEQSPCNHHALAGAGFVDRMLECLEAQIDEILIDEPAPTFRLLTRRLFLPQIRVERATAQYRNQPRFQELLRRLDERMQMAAGTYEQKIGLHLAL